MPWPRPAHLRKALADISTDDFLSNLISTAAASPRHRPPPPINVRPKIRPLSRLRSADIPPTGASPTASFFNTIVNAFVVAECRTNIDAPLALWSLTVHHYEVVYLIHEGHVEEVDSVALKVKDFIREKNGRIYRLNNWGLRRLAYKIKKAKKANYLLMNFEVEAKYINDFKTLLDRDERIIRHLVIKRGEAITVDCPPPSEFHTMKAGMDSSEEEEEDGEVEEEDWEDDDEFVMNADGENIILVGDAEVEMDDDVRSTRSSEFEMMATR